MDTTCTCTACPFARNTGLQIFEKFACIHFYLAIIGHQSNWKMLVFPGYINWEVEWIRLCCCFTCTLYTSLRQKNSQLWNSSTNDRSKYFTNCKEKFSDERLCFLHTSSSTWRNERHVLKPWKYLVYLTTPVSEALQSSWKKLISLRELTKPLTQRGEE